MTKEQKEMNDPRYCGACKHIHPPHEVDCRCYCDKVDCPKCGPRIAQRVVASAVPAPTPKCPQCKADMEPTFKRASIRSQSAVKVTCQGNELSHHVFTLLRFSDFAQFFAPSPATGQPPQESRLHCGCLENMPHMTSCPSIFGSHPAAVPAPESPLPQEIRKAILEALPCSPMELLDKLRPHFSESAVKIALAEMLDPYHNEVTLTNGRILQASTPTAAEPVALEEVAHMLAVKVQGYVAAHRGSDVKHFEQDALNNLMIAANEVLAILRRAGEAKGAKQ